MAKTKHKRKSPASIHATMADVNKAKKAATDISIKMCWGIFFRVLIDKHGYTQDQLKTLWNEINDYSSAVARGDISVSEILDTLKQEDGMVVV